MPLGNWNAQFLNQNSQRSYPLADWATGKDQTGTITIPDEFILAMRFPIHSGVDVLPDRFYLKKMTIYTGGVNLAIAYDDDSTAPPLVASVHVDFNIHEENLEYALGGRGDFSDSVGQIVIGRLTAINELPVGDYTFDRSGGQLEVDAIWPIVPGIMSITVVNGTDRSAQIVGDVEFTAGTNFRFTVNDADTPNPEIVFNAISGEGLNEDCVCEEAGEGECIRFINGIPPLPDGNFRVVGDDCLVIQPIANGIQLVEDCVTPCCGCEELDALTAQIDRFADGVLTEKNFSSRLSGEVTKMAQVVLGSRLSDGQGCIDC